LNRFLAELVGHLFVDRKKETKLSTG